MIPNGILPGFQRQLPSFDRHKDVLSSLSDFIILNMPLPSFVYFVSKQVTGFFLLGLESMISNQILIWIPSRTIRTNVYRVFTEFFTEMVAGFLIRRVVTEFYRVFRGNVSRYRVFLTEFILGRSRGLISGDDHFQSDPPQK